MEGCTVKQETRTSKLAAQLVSTSLSTPACPYCLLIASSLFIFSSSLLRID